MASNAIGTPTPNRAVTLLRFLLAHRLVVLIALRPRQVRWVAAGAVYEPHWSFARLTKPTALRSANPIDGFLAERIATAGLTGETDDFSYNITANPVAVNDLNATVLHCLGIDHAGSRLVPGPPLAAHRRRRVSRRAGNPCVADDTLAHLIPGRTLCTNTDASDSASPASIVGFSDDRG